MSNATATKFQVSVNPRRIGSLPCAIALGCCDLGEATVDGKRVTITWGQNANSVRAEWFAANTNFVPVETHVAGQYELIIPADEAKVLRGIVR